MATIEGRVGTSINRSVIMPTQDSIAVIECICIMPVPILCLALLMGHVFVLGVNVSTEHFSV